MKHRLTSLPWLTSAFVGAALVLTSCTCKIKDEQQAMINQLRTDEKQLTADIAKAETEKTKINAELSSRQADLRKCNERLNFVKDKMARWPHVWTGWDPNSPIEEIPAPAQPTTKTKKR